jgi:hypothetical protein
LSDYGGGSSPASIHYKAWVCSTPSCGFHIRIDNGEILVQTGDKPHWRSTKRGRGGGGGGGGGR